MCQRPGRVIPIFALATAGCLWGTGFYFGKIALREMPVSTMVLFRLLFACAACCLSCSLTVLALPGWNGSGFSPTSARGPVVFLLQFKGLSLTTVSHAALMVGTLPILLAIAAVLFAGEQLH